MIDPEQESILHLARLRRERIAVLRRRRGIAELRRQIGFETRWADTYRQRASAPFWTRRCWPRRLIPAARTIPIKAREPRRLTKSAHASTSGISAPPLIPTGAGATPPCLSRRRLIT